MNKVEGLHHLAICTGDMKAQLDYFTDKLGMELQALYWMHGVENTFHAFLRLTDESSIAFVHNPDIAKSSQRWVFPMQAMPVQIVRPAPCSIWPLK